MNTDQAQTPSTGNSLKIISLNVNSLINISRRLELAIFLKDNNPDIVCLNETKLNSTHKVSFDGYTMIRRDRKGAKRGGGVAILTKEKIKFSKVNNNRIDSLSYLETCIIRISTLHNKSLYLIAGYYPAGNNNELFKSELSTIFNVLDLQNPNNFYIFAGDLNSKHSHWGNSTNNSKGTALYNWLFTNEYKFRCSLYASTRPSYERANSFLDICLADYRLVIQKTNDTINCLKCIDYDSDHCAIQILVSKQDNTNLYEFETNENRGTLDYKRTNWRIFKTTCLNLLQKSIPTPNDKNLLNPEINHHLQKLSQIITTAIEKTVPSRKMKNQLQSISNSSIIRNLKKEKSKILTGIKKHNRLEILLPPNILNTEKAKLKIINSLIEENAIIQLNKQKEFELSVLKPNNPSKFGVIKKHFLKIKENVLSHVNVPFTHETTLKDAGLNPDLLEKNSLKNCFIVKDEKDMADLLGFHFQAVHSEKNSLPNNNVHSRVQQCFDQFLHIKNRFESLHVTKTIFSPTLTANDCITSSDHNFFISPLDIENILIKLKSKLSSGIDQIPNIVLKHLPSEMILEYCSLFNNMLNNSYFPPDWKIAKLIVIPKKDRDRNNLNNLRPISMLPNISKVFEIVINIKISKVIVQNSLNSFKQFGFKYGHSTLHAINLLVSEINWNWNKKFVTGACFIDFEKAFDTIWLQGLIAKLMSYGFPLYLLVLIYNMIFDRKFIVHVNNSLTSQPFDVVNGLQQGTVNAPILFSLFINDLLEKIDNIIAFADDIVIYHSSDKINDLNVHLQKKFDIIEEYSANWHLRINVNKCETILFRPPVNKCNSNVRKCWKQFQITSRNSNDSIPISERVKYLGIHLDKFLYFNDHINLKIEKTRKAFHIYKRMFSSSLIENRIKVLMYQTLIRPILCYGCSIWFNISPSYMERLRKCERKILRPCMSMFRSKSSDYTNYVSNLKLYNSSQIVRIDNYIINLTRNHIRRCLDNMDNPLIKASYYESDAYFSLAVKNGFTPPESFLYLDKEGYVQDSDGIPLIYHIYRRANNKVINSNVLSHENKRYDTSISERDKSSSSSSRKKCWWLAD